MRVDEAGSRLQWEPLIGRRDRMVCGEMKLKASREDDEIKIDEKSLSKEIFVCACDRVSDAILLGYLRYVERLYRHCM